MMLGFGEGEGSCRNRFGEGPERLSGQLQVGGGALVVMRSRGLHHNCGNESGVSYQGY